jgi:hypothetical protein
VPSRFFFKARLKPAGRCSATGQPELPPGRDGAHMRWTFLATKEKDEAGEYSYELLLYPSARWVSSVRTDIGEPIVVKRGLCEACCRRSAPRSGSVI